jgi:hypothetical protein
LKSWIIGEIGVVTIVSGILPMSELPAGVPELDVADELQAAIPSVRTATAAMLPASLCFIAVNSKVPGRPSRPVE